MKVLESAPLVADAMMRMSLLDQLLGKPEPTWFENASGRRGAFEGVAVSGGS